MYMVAGRIQLDEPLTQNTSISSHLSRPRCPVGSCSRSVSGRYVQGAWCYIAEPFTSGAAPELVSSRLPPRPRRPPIDSRGSRGSRGSRTSRGSLDDIPAASALSLLLSVGPAGDPTIKTKVRFRNFDDNDGSPPTPWHAPYLLFTMWMFIKIKNEIPTLKRMIIGVEVGRKIQIVLFRYM